MRTLRTLSSPNGPHWLVDFKHLDEELHYLRSLIERFRADPEIRALAVHAVRHYKAPQRNKAAQARACAQWCRDNLTYLHELPERFQWPDETLRTRSGDCDDFTTLIGSMIESIGIPCVMVTMEINGVWSHIFPAAQVGTPPSLLPLDATNKFPISVNPVKFSLDKGKKVRLKLA